MFVFFCHSSRIFREKNLADWQLSICQILDRYEDWKISESDLIELIRELVQAWEASLPSDQEIVLPLQRWF